MGATETDAERTTGTADTPGGQTTQQTAQPTQQFGTPYGGYGAYGASSPPPTSTYPPYAGGGAPPPRGPRRTMTGVVAAALIAGLVGGGVGFGGAYALIDGSGGSTTTLGSSADPSASSAPADGTVAGAAAKATPSTVDIQVRTAQGAAEGSGVILTADGDVLTNNHVVAGAQGGQITVTLADGSTHQASVVGTSPSYDLAVIKLQGVSGLTAATLGQSSDVKVGEQVVAIGSPQGLSGTVTAGIVSAQNRTVTAGGEQGEQPVVYNGLQTDAPINQGNSGGPLVNLAGQVVGINSAIATSGQNSGSIGLGFAIPVDTARRVAQELMNGGTATKPQLGVQGQVSASSSGATPAEGGARISGVQAGSAAANAGLKAGDVVTKVGDTPVTSFTDLVARVGNYAPGQTIPLTVTSGGQSRTVQVTLGSVPDTAATTGQGSTQGGSSGQGDGSGQGGSGQGGSSPFGGVDPFGGGLGGGLGGN
ncbi:S1C family serine protease [Pseudonocardia endophytica]|uniref:Putative serine protease PepD n=1 Tax=Pseudonocardia endophytica TaxID=401976 RepID=A0A4V2PIX1_PSEEN|nr:trypsin-like peptidase domain-containing protein [Pseudonocardia endophytica]TCK26036.1 putative serine protease PepD [Pseudonocardia endophytica]